MGGTTSDADISLGFRMHCSAFVACRERIFIKLMASDRNLEASREGLEMKDLWDLKELPRENLH